MAALTKPFKDVDESHHTYNFYLLQKDELKNAHIKQINLTEFVNKIFESKHFELFKNLFKNVKDDFLYKSDKHGKMHNFRVSLFAVYISDELKLSEEDTKLVLYAAMYHDIGRRNDLEDLSHGALGANLIDKLRLPIKSDDLKILKCVIAAHSLSDLNYQDVEQKYCIQEKKRCRQIYQILKDADALDRVRLGQPYIKRDYLRTNIAEHLILTAYQLENNFNLIYNEIME